MEKVRVGIAGLGYGTIGYLANARYWIYGEVIAVMDVDKEKVKEIQERYQIPYSFTRYEEMITMQELDAVVICTPPVFHVEQACAAARAGKHVLCEKPMAPTVAECRQIIECCEKNQVYLFVGFMKHFDMSMCRVKELIDSGTIGPVQQIISKWSWNEPTMPMEQTYWRAKYPLTHGGVFQDHGPHVLDLCRWWVGEIEYISGEVNILHDKWEVEDNYNVICRHTSGAVSVLSGSRNCHKSLTEYYLIDGAYGSIELYFDHEWTGNCPMPFRMYLHRNGTVREDITVPQHMNIDMEYAEHGRYVRTQDYFFECILNHREPKVNTGYDGLKTVEGINAAYLSSYKKEKIQLPLTEEQDEQLKDLKTIFDAIYERSPKKRLVENGVK